MKGKKLWVIIGSIVIAAGCFAGGYAYNNSQVEKAQDKSIAQVNSLVSLDDYRNAQQKEVQAVMDEYDKKISETRDKEEL